MSVSAYNEENWIPVNENASCLSVDKIICDKNGVLHASGVFVTLSGDTVEGLVRKIEDDWEPVGTIRGTVSTFTFDIAGNIYAAGNLYLDDTGSFAHFAKYDGETWSAFGGKRGSSYNSVRVLAVDSVGNVYAGGYFKKLGDDSVRSIGYWDGNRWNKIKSTYFANDSTDGVDGEVNAIAFTRTSLEVGGNFTIYYGNNHVLESMGSWYDGYFHYYAGQGCSRRDPNTLEIVVATVYDIALSANREKMWIGGNFSGFDGWTNYGLAGSSGGTFLGPASAVIALEPYGNDGVFLCGSLNTSSKPAKSSKMMYHGSGLPDFTNFMITNGPNGTVSDMAYDSLSHSLYIADSFNKVGSKRSPKIAKFFLDPPVRAVQPGKFTNAKSSVMLTGKNLLLSGFAAGDYKVTLFSLNGRQLFSKDLQLSSQNAMISLPFKAEGSFICKIASANGGRDFMTITSVK